MSVTGEEGMWACCVFLGDFPVQHLNRALVSWLECDMLNVVPVAPLANGELGEVALEAKHPLVACAAAMCLL